MKVGLIFPGQGSQQVGMGAEFLDHAIARNTFEEAGDALGFDLQRMCLEGPEDELVLTYNAQAAILTVSTIAHRLLAERIPLDVAAVAGHSLGEYSALVSVGVLPFTDAVRTVYQRGKFMQEATPVGMGAMAAVLGMDAEALERLCGEVANGQVVAPANYNTQAQIVISGHAEAVHRVLQKARGKLLTVSAPFHSSLMQPAADRMREVLGAMKFSNPSAPVVANTTNEFISNAVDFPATLERQITSPVRWNGGVTAMIAHGISQFVELGHGRVLSGLMRRIDKSVAVVNIAGDGDLNPAVEALRE